MFRNIYYPPLIAPGPRPAVYDRTLFPDRMPVEDVVEDHKWPSDEVRIHIPANDNDSGPGPLSEAQLRQWVLSGTEESLAALSDSMAREGAAPATVLRYLFSQGLFTFGDLAKERPSLAPFAESVPLLLMESPDWLVSELLIQYEQCMAFQKRTIDRYTLWHTIVRQVGSIAYVAFVLCFEMMVGLMSESLPAMGVFLLAVSFGLCLVLPVLEKLKDKLAKLFQYLVEKETPLLWTPQDMMHHDPAMAHAVKSVLDSLGIGVDALVTEERVSVLVQQLLRDSETRFVRFLQAKGVPLISLDYSMSGDRKQDGQYCFEAVKAFGVSFCYLLCRAKKNRTATLATMNIRKDGYDYRSYHGAFTGTHDEPHLADLPPSTVHPLSYASLSQLQREKPFKTVGEQRIPVLLERREQVVKLFSSNSSTFFSPLRNRVRQRFRKELKRRNVFLL